MTTPHLAAASDTPGHPPVPPPMQLFQMMTAKFVTRPMYVAAELRLADQVEAGPKAVADLAAATGTHAPTLYRLLRALASVGVFAEVAPRTFAQTALSGLLVDRPGSLRGMCLWMNDPRHDRAWHDLRHSVETGAPAVERAYGYQVFELLSAEPDLGALFADAMTGLAAVAHRAVAEGYDFSSCRDIVDVGGGHGRLLIEILSRYPEARGVVFDLPQVIPGAEAALAASGLNGRCTAAGGSFFDAVPAGADTYLLSFILHDWDDERAVAILRRCRAAMKPGGRLLASEGLVPPGNAPSFHKLLDLEMLVMTPGGRERTEAEFAELFQAAGLELRRIVPVAGPNVVLEGWGV